MSAHLCPFSVLTAIAFVCVFSLAGVAGAQPPQTESSSSLVLQFPLVDHSIYGQLERMETLGEVPLLSATRPYLGFIRHPVPVSREPVVTRERTRYLSESAANMEIIGWPSEQPIESSWRSVRRILGIAPHAAPWLYRSGYHLASFGFDTTFSIAIQPVYGLEAINTDDERGTISRFAGGFRVEGGYSRRLHFTVDFRDHTETGNGPYSSRTQLYGDRWAAVDLKGKSSTSYDISESFIQYYGRDLSAAAGRGRFRWGTGYFGSLFLGSNMPPFDYVRFDAALESRKSNAALYYTFLHGWLESQVPRDYWYEGSDGRQRILSEPKCLSAQRVELRPNSALRFGLSQGVIYGDYRVRPGYFTPLNFLYSVQHSNDDKDNLVLALDGMWRPVRGLKLYGEAFFDDVLVGDLMKSTGNNKSAFTLGVHGIPPRGEWRRLDVRLEYTKIRPFVYTHVFDVNRYTHWYSPIGYTLEPNSEFMNAELGCDLYPVRVSLLWSRQNHGANTPERNVGGSVYTGAPGDLDAEYPFLDGEFVRSIRWGARAEWEALPSLRLFAQGTSVEQSHADRRLEAQVGFGWNL